MWKPSRRGDSRGLQEGQQPRKGRELWASARVPQKAGQAGSSERGALQRPRDKGARLAVQESDFRMPKGTKVKASSQGRAMPSAQGIQKATQVAGRGLGSVQGH